ncbi:histone-lysine N-methyltransferase SETMAR [Elysia marginata]|uniref:Histone-lysine N-methyltransferase SETMAR n=1 Tax=Elysia marginata TaxID=1093978 RepID=A0AAV4G327_9GAST|nr:histone-lysine N-methyltransferase SETMAR [Elysia marginata]
MHSIVLQEGAARQTQTCHSKETTRAVGVRHLVSPRQCASPYGPGSDRRFGWLQVGTAGQEHPCYSPDLAPCDFHLFPKIKEHLRGQRFETEEDIIQATKVAIKNLDKCSNVTAFKN